MSIYTRACADDVRALAGAIVLGSSVGLALGGACLLGGPALSGATPAPAASGVLQAAASPIPAGIAKAPAPAVVQPGVSSGVQGLAMVLRDRFRLGAPAGPSAAPFGFARVAQAPSDLHCLAETVYFEARGESVEGQRAVAQVVLNRVRHPAFPKTVCGVVHQHTAAGCQFTFACSTREPATDTGAWRRAEAVASAELHGAVMAAVGDATHFQTARSGPFAGLLKVAQIGAHVFYRFAGHGGAPGMFHQTPAPSPEPARIELARLEPTASGVASPSATGAAPPASSSAVPPAKAPVLAVKLSPASPGPVSAAVRLVAGPSAPAAVPQVTKPPAPALPKPVGAAPTLALAQS